MTRSREIRLNDAARFRRIWAIVQLIADRPGQERRAIADRFHICERQIQADLTIIRNAMQLPLVRHRGYRFMAEGALIAGAAGGLTLEDALTLVLGLDHSDGRWTDAERDRLDRLVARLPVLFPPHLGPLVSRVFDALRSPRSGQDRVIAALAEAMLDRTQVRLHEIPGTEQTAVLEPVIRPDLLVPYRGEWFVIGTMDARDLVRDRMLALRDVEAVTLAGVS